MALLQQVDAHEAAVEHEAELHAEREDQHADDLFAVKQRPRLRHLLVLAPELFAGTRLFLRDVVRALEMQIDVHCEETAQRVHVKQQIIVSLDEEADREHDRGVAQCPAQADQGEPHALFLRGMDDQRVRERQHPLP